MSQPREGCSWDDALRIRRKERDNEYFTYYQTGEEALWRRFVDIASGSAVPEDLRVLPCFMASRVERRGCTAQHSAAQRSIAQRSA